MRRVHRTGSAAVLVAALGCTPIRDVTPPPVDGAGTLLVAIERSGLRALYASREGDLAVPLTLREGDQLTALYYPETLGELGVAAGPVERSGAGERDLTGFIAAFRAELGGGAPVWGELEELPETLRQVRLPGQPARECVERGGCRRDGRCVVPCPLPPAPMAPEPVDEPHDPMFPACAAPDWSDAVTERGVRWCARTEPVTCPHGFAHLAGAAACEPIGPPCPPGQWPEDLPPGPVLHVSAAAAEGGDGTPAAPYRRLDQVLAFAAPGAVIAVARGVYAAGATIDGISIAGVCAAETELQGTITATGAGASLRGVHLSGVAGDAVLVARAGLVELDGVSIATTGASAGLLVHTGATVRARGVVIRGPGDHAVLVAGGDVHLSRVLLEGGRHGVRADGGHVTLEDAVVRAATEVSILADAAELTLARVLVADSGQFGVLAQSDAHAVLRDVHVRGSETAAELVEGVRVFEGSAELAGVVIERHRRAALSSQDAELELQDVITLDTAEDPTRENAGLLLVDSTVTVHRASIERTHGRGVYAARSSLSGEDLAVLGPRVDPELAAMGLLAEGARLDLTRVAIEDAFDHGVIVFECEASALRDVSIVGAQGEGITIRGVPSVVTIDRLIVRGALTEGLEVRSGAVAFAFSVDIAGFGTSGVSLFHQSALTLERALIEDGNDGINVTRGVYEGLAAIDAHDVQVTRVLRGVAVEMGGSNGVLSGFHIEAEQYGAYVTGQATLNWSNGVVRGSDVGAHVPSESAVPGVVDGVRYEEVGVAIETSLD